MSLLQTQGFWPVTAALLGNAFVTAIKFVAAVASGSSVMFSEAIHSTADTLNQALLLVGLRQSLKKPDEDYEYGYGNERFFWALISACGIFFVGAGVTAYTGIQSLISHEAIEFSFLIAVVLSVSFIVELYTLRIAARKIAETFPTATWLERIDLADSATLAVLLEDAVAVLGVVVAGASIVASYLTRSTLWDAVGSLAIAFLLGSVAIILIVKNRSYLLGRSIPDDMREEVIALLEKDPAIEKVIDFKSNVLGLGVYRIKCEVEFNGAALARKSYREANLKEQFEEIQNDFEQFKRFSADYADRIPRLIGKKIDEIEALVQKKYPSIRHIDIEVN